MSIFDKMRKTPAEERIEPAELEGPEINLAKENADRELPSVNSSKPSNKMLNKLLFVCILIFGLYVIYQVNAGPGRKAKALAEQKAKEAKDNAIDGALPALSAIAPPPPPTFAVPGAENGAMSAGKDSNQTAAPSPQPAPIPVKVGPNGKPEKTPYELAQERRRRGLVLTKMQGDESPDEQEGGNAARTQQTVPGSQFAANDGSPLGQALVATATPATSAKKTIDRNFLLAKGGFLDCAMETRIDSTQPGMTSCILTRNVYSDNGKLILLDRGSKLTGQYQGGIKHGQARIFVLWTRAQTPNGVVIDLNSPGTDSLGASGLEGYVDSHFMERFGGAILMSIIGDLAQFVTSSGSKSNSENTQINFGNTATSSSNVATEVIKNTINIPPTLMKNQGEHINVFVARDLDFRPVYGIEPR